MIYVTLLFQKILQLFILQITLYYFILNGINNLCKLNINCDIRT